MKWTFFRHCLTYSCKNGNTPSIFKHIYTLKPISKYTTRSKNVLFKPLCKRNFTKFKLSYRGPHLWKKFIAPNNDLLEVVTANIFKIRFKNMIFASTNILEDYWNYFHINWNLLHSPQDKSCWKFWYDMRFSVINHRSFFEFTAFSCSFWNIILVLFHVADIVCLYVKIVFMFQKTKNKQTNKQTNKLGDL